ncbi:MAG: IS1634 family transposase [Dehalococcoidia bacterium]|nr:IS1634 family transposase [Dehalococcoidia bacterium]
MRLSISKSKNSETLYVIKSTYVNKKHSSKIVEKLGSPADIKKRHPDSDPYDWAKGYIRKLTKEEQTSRREILVKYSPIKPIQINEARLFNGGYLFLQQIYNELGISVLCNDLKKRHRFTFDIAEVLACLIYSRILHPSSKLETHHYSQSLLEPSEFDIQHVYRSLEVLAKESDLIQATIYKNFKNVAKRNDRILYYDCTNYFFEMEQEDGLKQYGISKEHRPNPLVQMGLFMDGDGIPLAFEINAGNTNEQTTLIPLEKKILSDFKHSRFIVCTDAGLSSYANRRFNNLQHRSFITTQSIKLLKEHLKQWALDPKNWKLSENGKTYNISELDEEKHFESMFYKDRWIHENGLEQRLIVTYSLKHRNYQRNVRNSQIERAEKLISKRPKAINRANQNDYKRFITQASITNDGEVAENVMYGFNEELLSEEVMYDGFYGVCTNIEDDAQGVVSINRRRWEIEECFRIMKHEFKARPVFLSRGDRIKAHFLTCFIALIVFRILENRLENRYTCTEIIRTLRTMDFHKIKGEGFLPSYTRTDITDALHDAFGFRTDYEIVTTKQIKKIISLTKNAGNNTHK